MIHRFYQTSPSEFHQVLTSSSSGLAVVVSSSFAVIVPRSSSQLYLEKFLATLKKTQVAAGEYCGLRGSREPYEVEASISGISKLLVSQFINLQSRSQYKIVHVCL
ncbi:hypothetical protein Bca4012_083349 [Brassica carinata]